MSSIKEITWAGLANQPFTLNPAISAVVTLPPYRVDSPGATLIYTDTIRVKLPLLAKPIGTTWVGPWLVQRLTLSSPDFSEFSQSPTVVKTTNLPIDKQGIAKGLPYNLSVDIGLLPVQWVRYQLVRYKKIAGNKLVPYVLEGSAVDIRPQPHLGRPAYAGNAYRPLPCEFETLSFELLGKQGQVLQTIQGGAYPPINVPISEAKANINTGNGNLLTYSARWTLKRINLPNYPPTQIYNVQYGVSQNVFVSELKLVQGLSELNPPTEVGQTFTVTFDIYRATGSGETTWQLCLGNVLTDSKFTPDTPASIQAEANFMLNW